MSDVLVQFGLKVRQARTAKLWTLTQLAHQAFGNQDRKGYVSQIENGRKPITALTVAKLAKALDLPASVTNPILGLALPETEVETEEDKVAEALIASNPAKDTPDISESLLIALAFEYAKGSHGDLQSAYLGLRAALQTAAQMQHTARLPHNTSDQVDAVLAEVDRLNRAGQLEAGAQALETALAEARDRIAQQTSGLMRMLDSAVDQARLLNRPQDAADALVERLLLDTPADAFNALLALQDAWYERGRDQGLAFDATVAIHLAEHSLFRAQTPDQRGAALNNLGNALATLGEREAGTARLEQAVAAFEAALLEWPRDRVPLDWAMTQMNLGNALQTLGEREAGTARLEQAVAAYEAALQERTRDRVPLGWAMTQMNLGTALLNLGARESGTARLEQAVAAFEVALLERTRDRVPLDWAMTQNNLGNALATLGEREVDTARLEQAVAAYEAALQERTRDRVPLDWAMTHFNLSLVEISFFDKTADPAHLARARDYVMAAREVFMAARADHYIGMADQKLAAITAREQA